MMEISSSTYTKFLDLPSHQVHALCLSEHADRLPDRHVREFRPREQAACARVVGPPSQCVLEA